MRARSRSCHSRSVASRPTSRECAAVCRSGRAPGASRPIVEEAHQRWVREQPVGGREPVALGVAQRDRREPHPHGRSVAWSNSSRGPPRAGARVSVASAPARRSGSERDDAREDRARDQDAAEPHGAACSRRPRRWHRSAAGSSGCLRSSSRATWSGGSAGLEPVEEADGVGERGAPHGERDALLGEAVLHRAAAGVMLAMRSRPTASLAAASRRASSAAHRRPRRRPAATAAERHRGAPHGGQLALVPRRRARPQRRQVRRAGRAPPRATRARRPWRPPRRPASDRARRATSQAAKRFTSSLPGPASAPPAAGTRPGGRRPWCASRRP